MPARHPRPLVAFGYLVQGGLAAALLVVPVVAAVPSWFFYAYYAAGVVAVPAVVRQVAGRPLTPLQRVYFALGLSLHPFSMYTLAYRAFWWWDALAHFVSGTLVAAGCYIGLYALHRRARSRLLDRHLVHVWTFALVLAFGLAWEVYEVYAPWLTNYGLFDQVKDLLVDLAGWAVVAHLAPRTFGALPLVPSPPGEGNKEGD